MKLIIRLLLIAIGASGALLSMPCFNLALEQPNTEGVIIFLFMALAILTPSTFILYKAIKTPRPTLADIQQQETTERIILQIARAHKGRTTAAYVASKISLPIKQTTQILENLEKRGLIYSAITPQGGIEFIFPDFLETTTHALKANTDFEEFDSKLNEQNNEQNHVLDHQSPKQAFQETHPNQPAYKTTDQP